MRDRVKNMSYNYLLLIISAVLPVLYITEVITENMFHKLLYVIFFTLSSYAVLLEKYKFHMLMFFIGAVLTYVGMPFPLILSLWLFSLVFSRKPYAIILGAGVAYVIMLKLKTLGLESSLAPYSSIILDTSLNYLELSLILLGLISVIAIAFIADVKRFEIGSLAQILALVVIVEAILVVISWVNVLTSVVTVYGISTILFIRAIEKHRT